MAQTIFTGLDIVLLKIESYIGKSLVMTFFVSLVIIVGLDFVAAFVDEMGKIRGNYNITEALLYVLRTLPGRIYEFVPFAVLIGSLISLGQFSSNSELVVMRASGMTKAQITWIILKPVTIIALLAVVIGEVLAPIADISAENRRNIMMNKGAYSFGRYGVWNREGDTFIHFNTVDSMGEATGITLFKFDERRSLRSALRADRALFEGDHWTLINVKKTEFFKWETRGVLLDKLRWDTAINPRSLLIEMIDPLKLKISDLYYYLSYLTSQDRVSASFELAFWRKLFFPITLLGLVFVGASFVFGPLREGSIGFRIFVGVMIGITFKVSQDLLGPSSIVFGFSPILVAVIPILGCIFVGGILMARFS